MTRISLIKRILPLLIMVLLLTSFYGCTEEGGNPEKDVNQIVAKVGEEELNQQQLVEYMAFTSYVSGFSMNDLDKEAKAEFRQLILEQLVEDALIQEYLERQQTVVMDEEAEATVQHYLDSIYFNSEVQSDLESMEISEDTIKHYYISERYADFFMNRMAEEDEALEPVAREYYESNKESLVEVETNHILVNTAEEAKEIKGLLEQGADVGSVAKERSQDKESAPDGYGGARILESLDPEYAKAIRLLKPGEISGPVKTSQGYYIIQLLEYRDDYEDFDNTIRRLLAESKYDDYLEILKKEIPIQYYK